MHKMSRVALLLIGMSFTLSVVADEGMWTFDNFPSAKMQAKYGWAPDAAWLKHAQLSSIRLAQGCSASLVSPDGLVMTNHHCARECVSDLADAKHDYIANGFYAATAADEKKCPALEANQLVEITDVTKQVRGGDGRQVGPRISRGRASGQSENRKRVRHGARTCAARS